jgi:hypothetical protein
MMRYYTLCIISYIWVVLDVVGQVQTSEWKIDDSVDFCTCRSIPTKSLQYNNQNLLNGSDGGG